MSVFSNRKFKAMCNHAARRNNKLEAKFLCTTPCFAISHYKLQDKLLNWFNLQPTK